jgi:hypothetical protein
LKKFRSNVGRVSEDAADVLERLQSNLTDLLKELGKKKAKL